MIRDCGNMTVRRHSRIFIAASALVAATAASACGVCVEDRIAATYDHAVIRQAAEQRRQVVFVGVDGYVRPEDVRRDLARARVPGVVAGTVRTSASPAAFSFALDGSGEPAQAVEAFRKAVHDPRARFTVLRVVRDGRMQEPR
jgi:hypothetical protein